jgi:hypothetical protein
MADKVIYELRVVRNPEGVWLETIYPEDGKRTRISRLPCDKNILRPRRHRMKDRSHQRMRKSLDFLEGLYNDLYGNVEK